MSHHRLEAIHLKYAYPDGHEALHDVSFEATHGECVGIIGANGAGKSTLLMLLMGLLHPGAGTVRIGEVELTRKTLPDIRKRVGMVFQNPDDQLFMPTVGEDAAFGPRNAGLSESEVQEKVTAALSRVGILHLRDRAPFKLSGGEKHAAAIASVLAMDPDILVLDEPTAGLDPRARRRVMGLLESFSHTRLITGHDLDMILALCPRVVILREGRVAADGPSSTLLADSELMEACGLEVPSSLQPCAKCGYVGHRKCQVDMPQTGGSPCESR